MNLDAQFEQMYRKYFPAVRALFARWGLDREERHDLAQETFLRVYRGLSDFRGDASEKAWILAVARRSFAQFMRNMSAQKRDGRTVPLEEMADDGWYPGIEFESDSDVEGEAIAREQQRALSAALNALPERMRWSLLLQIDGLSYRQIAALMGISRETVKSHLEEGRKRLEEVLGEKWKG